MARKKKMVFAIVGLAVLVAAALFFATARRAEQTATDAHPFITANPFDFAQIQAISQFRSCEGHNFSGLNVDGVEETYRTMKHYIEAREDLTHSTGQVKIFAPFDGRISDIRKDGRGSQVYLSPTDDSGWDFLYFHVDLLPHLEDGAHITAGEHIGFANLSNNAANFDISLRWFGFGPQRNDSPFFYMTNDVLGEYAAAGITQSNIIISKEVRDADPCELAPGQSGRDAFYAQHEAEQSWIQLQ